MSVRQRQKSFLLAASILPFVVVACVLPVDFWDEHTVTVHVVAANAAALETTEILDLSHSTDVTAYLKAVTQVQIPVVQILVSNIQSDNSATRMSGSLSLSDPSDSSWPPVILTYSNAPLSGGIVEMVPAPADVERLSAMLLAKKKLREHHTASFDILPAHFELTTRIHITTEVDSSKM